MTLQVQTWGQTPQGQDVLLYTMRNSQGLSVSVTTYGAILTSVIMPGHDGKPDEITLGFDTLEDYLAGHPYFGATCGRVANRIDRGRFSLDGKDYKLACNDQTGTFHLHGGNRGFDKVLWNAEPVQEENVQSVIFSYQSPDGEEGYPGCLKVKSIYRLTNDNELITAFEAITDAPTPVNLTNHAYWNLGGSGSGPIYAHQLQINADQYLEKDERGVPTGVFCKVAGTPMDFTVPRPLGKNIDSIAPGYDHCYVLQSSLLPGNTGLPNTAETAETSPTPAAWLYEPTTRRQMRIWTTQPGIQLYTAGFLTPTRGHRGRLFDQHHGICLETQHFPDAVHHPAFPDTILRPGQTYQHQTVHQFSIKEN